MWYSDSIFFSVPPMLDECLEYLESRRPALTFEVIVVSDGSKDGTAQVAKEYTKKHGSNAVRVLELETNRGKGGAIRLVRFHLLPELLTVFINLIFLDSLPRTSLSISFWDDLYVAFSRVCI
jgi:glycosyltransferase involved in cell wall biosynthesis